MKIAPTFALVGVALLLSACGTAFSTNASEEPSGTVAAAAQKFEESKEPEESLEEMAAMKYAEFSPPAGHAVAFKDADGFWHAVYRKEKIESYDKAAADYPENVIPATIGEFSFVSYSPYDSGFSAAENYEIKIILNKETESLQGKEEGIIPLPVSCGQSLYGVCYQSAEGKVLILTVDTLQVLAEDSSLIRKDRDGQELYQKPNQPYTLGIQAETGPAIWLSTVFPETGTAYTSSNPKAELPQEELAELLIQTAEEFGLPK